MKKDQDNERAKAEEIRKKLLETFSEKKKWNDLVGEETPAKKWNTGSEISKLIREKNEADRQLKIEEMALQKQEVELRKEEVNLYREEAHNQMMFFQEQLCMQQEEMRRNNQMMQMRQQQQQMFMAMMNVFDKKQ